MTLAIRRDRSPGRPGNVHGTGVAGRAERVSERNAIRGARGYLTAFAAMISACVVCRSRYPSRKSFAQDHAVLIENERTRIGHARRPAFGSVVAYVIGIDRLAFGIGEQRGR